MCSKIYFKSFTGVNHTDICLFITVHSTYFCCRFNVSKHPFGLFELHNESNAAKLVKLGKVRAGSGEDVSGAVKHVSGVGEGDAVAGSAEDAHAHVVDVSLGGGRVDVELSVRALHCEPVEQLE